MRMLVLLSSIGACVAAFAWWTTADRDPPDAQTSVDRSAASSLAAMAVPAPAPDPVARARIRDLSARVDELSASERTAPAEAAADRTPPLDSPEDIEADMTARVDAMEESLRTGARDSWAATSESSLAAAYQELQSVNADLGMRVTGVACSAELCRIALAFAQPDGPAAALPILSDSIPWPGERLYQAMPGDRPEVIVYAARDDIPLPR